MDSQKKHLDPDYHARNDYDQHNKVFPESQESSRNIINTSFSHNIQHMVTSNHQANKCYYRLFTDSDAILKILSVDFCGKESKFGVLVQNCVRIQIFTRVTRHFTFVISSQDYPWASEI